MESLVCITILHYPVANLVVHFDDEKYTDDASTDFHYQYPSPPLQLALPPIIKEKNCYALSGFRTPGT